MILTNYWNYIDVFGKEIPAISAHYISMPGLKFMDDNDDRAYDVVYGMDSSSSEAAVMAENYAIRYNLGVAIGNGNTAVTTSDRKLDSEIASASIPDLSYTVTTGIDQNVFKLTAIVTGTNVTANDITIRELGIYKNVHTNSYWSQDVWRLLFVRHVLQSPITVQPTHGFSFAFEWIDE